LPALTSQLSKTRPLANDFDYLGYLDEWVENGHAPDKMIGEHVDTDAFMKAHANEVDLEKLEADFSGFMHDPAIRTFGRPVYLYPAYAKYKGSADPSKAENFVPSHH
jgi:Tannase and feruloyl esterase